MPELPEVETVVRGLHATVQGKTIQSIELIGRPTFRLKVPSFLTTIKSARIDRIMRHGKGIYFVLITNSSQVVLKVHLGMTGQLLWLKKEEPLSPHTHAVFRLNDTVHELRYRDIRRFGQFSLSSEVDFSRFVPDAYTASLPTLVTALKNAKGQLKQSLMGQKVMAGLGNIYVDESLYLAGFHPLKSLGRLSDESRQKLCVIIKEVLQKSIDLGGTSFSNYVDVHGGRGGFKGRLFVYGKKGEPCSTCKTPIKRIVVGGRGTYFCSRCQKK